MSFHAIRVTCGQLPPNCDKGHGFVHDPNVAGVPEVKAQIRLMFRTGTNNQTVVATRTFQLTNTRSKAGIKSTFKALENLIRFKDGDGENSTSNRRCADMDNAIPALMGVTQAIIEHVIFCHQEDSNWPLSERPLLKKRFDEIFGSSRYTKALETIEKQRKEIVKESKEKSHVLALVSKDRDSVIELRRERNRLCDLLANITERICNFDRQISRKESELHRLQQLETEFRDKLIKVEQLNRDIAKLKNLRVINPISSVSELNHRMESLNQEIGNLEAKKTEINTKITAEKSKFESLVKERTELAGRLRSLRNSQLESSNLHDLIRLKLGELEQAVSSAKSSQFLPEFFAFNFDQPGLSIKEMELIVESATATNDAEISSLVDEVKNLENAVKLMESKFQKNQRDHMQLVSDCSLIESKIKSATEEMDSTSSKLRELIPSDQTDAESFFQAEIKAIDVELRKIQSSKRGNLSDVKSDLTDLISDSVQSVSLMHLSPSELLQNLDSKKQFLSEKIESVLKSISCACPVVQSSPELDLVTEELVGARQTLSLLTSLKAKSINETKCQVCRQKLNSVSEFESAVDRLTRRLPDIITVNESKRQGLIQQAYQSVEELRKSLLPELIETEKSISRIQAFMDAIARLGAADQPAVDQKQLEMEEEWLSKKNSTLVVQQASFRALVERQAGIETVLEDYRMELAVLNNEQFERSQVELETARAELEKSRSELTLLTQKMNSEKSRFDSCLNYLRNSFQIIFQIASQVDGLRSRLAQEGGTAHQQRLDLSAMEARETELSNLLTSVMGLMSSGEDERGSIDSDISTKRKELEEMRSQIELKKLEEELSDVKAEIGQRDCEMESSSSFQEELTKIRDERSKLLGESNQIGIQISECEKKLASASFNDIDEKYRQAFCSVENHNILAKDVQRYHQALDRALMSYHSQKMSQINEVIRDLWGRIYKGTDIDYIAIRSDTETEDENTAKRSYNYRVVMVKGDVELEMRGRCSAGQKVVACLIIRLALAESFCLSCGILALDEPTTNLDRGNIGGLAEALADLIAARRDQNNFQLIIITHDESFVNMLGNLRACDHFYRVRKNEFGYSTIARANIHEIHTRAR